MIVLWTLVDFFFLIDAPCSLYGEVTYVDTPSPAHSHVSEHPTRNKYRMTDTHTHMDSCSSHFEMDSPSPTISNANTFHPIVFPTSGDNTKIRSVEVASLDELGLTGHPWQSAAP